MDVVPEVNECFHITHGAVTGAAWKRKPFDEGIEAVFAVIGIECS